MVKTKKEEMKEMTVDFDGIEVHEDDWPIAEKLVKEEGFTLGPPRGPDRAWRRLRP